MQECIPIYSRGTYVEDALMMSGISSNTLTGFKEYLELKERSDATIEKYLHEIRMLQVYIDDRELTKNELIAYRLKISKCYQPQTINGKLNAINCFLKYLGLNDMCEGI